jgi:hypothetical protein
MQHEADPDRPAEVGCGIIVRVAKSRTFCPLSVPVEPSAGRDDGLEGAIRGPGNIGKWTARC